MEQQPSLHRGLKGAYFERSAVSFIDGRVGDLRYRGYSIHELAEHSTFEETAFLLIYGELPNRQELEDFCSRVKAQRSLPPQILDIIGAMSVAHPMEVLRT